MVAIHDFYRNISGKHPEQSIQSPVASNPDQAGKAGRTDL
jgi:hypothetical protein